MCHLCGKENPLVDSHGGEHLMLGSAEIRSFSNRGAIFAAPDLIFHYVSVHHYNPPVEFITSLSEGPCPSSPEFLERLRKLGYSWSAATLLSEKEAGKITKWRLPSAAQNENYSGS